ncbi:hypothetical protein H2201_005709 [Coniosporium apollinis]|uniref:Rhomboid family membrane protein n=1 Tax=Coniosporium apollinis TaxID=61459 RepID=A0ABQ9NP81_9PEZI|nr:hypothetical protein H2201_005709 [Coniosporium apollinis]
MTTTPQKPLSASAEQHNQYGRLAHNTALACLFLCPAIALLPPRKLDLYTFGLAGIWGLSANHMIAYHSGRSVLGHLRHGMGSVNGSELPTEQAREFQKRVREEREEIARRGREERERAAGLKSAQEAFTGQIEGREKERQKGVLERVWMGGETEGWKERRLREEQEAIDEGRGYGGLIMDQIWEVWNWGKKKEEDGEAETEKGERSREG